MAYVYGKSQIKRVFGIGDYADQWIDVRRATERDVRFAGGKGNTEILAMLIADWSIVDEDGQKVPVSADVLSELPIEISVPALNYCNEIFLPFTALAQPKSDSSKS
jgi:hypothetical protein